MKIVIITCFQPYENRVDSIAEYFRERKHEVTIIASDFLHISKVYRSDLKNNYTLVNTKPYYTNFSFKRIISHILFSLKASKLAYNSDPDLIYAILPPNTIAYILGRRRRAYNKVKLVFDIMDLWPETIPAKIRKDIGPLKIWKNLRNKNLKFADYVITECELFMNLIAKYTERSKLKTVYLTKKDSGIKPNVILSEDEIHFCYLGSVNNVIDIDMIVEILVEVKKRKNTLIHIIGEGENLDKFISKLHHNEITVIYHGKIYSTQKKQVIFDQCHFGLNIMKNTVCVGLTMKSIDYFAAGLPVVSNISHDTEKFIGTYNNGYNINVSNFVEVIESITKTSLAENKIMRESSQKLFQDFFSQEAFVKNMNSWFTKMFEGEKWT